MKYAGVDIVGLLIFVAVVIFQIVSQFIKANQEKKNLQPPTTPQQDDPQAPKPSRREPEEFTDPFDELLEALGKKPGQAPSQLPQPPQQSKPSRPLPPLTPSAPPPLPYPVFTAPKTVPAPSVRQPAPLSQSAPSMETDNDTARVQAELARIENKPVFETVIGSDTSLTHQAAENIARVANAPTNTPAHPAYRPAVKDVKLPELVARLRNPVEIRRAIVANEILGAPVALR